MTVGALIRNYKTNFLQRSVEIVPGLLFNQYETIKRVYYYQHNQFESGPYDDAGNAKYFYDLMTDRNDQATKNIDIDTKDCYIKAANGSNYLLAWLLRQEFMSYAQLSGFGHKLNELADDLPDFGTVVWKKFKNNKGDIDFKEVELINIVNDPQANKLSDGMLLERHLLTQEEMREKKVWNQDAVERLISSGRTTIPTRFMSVNASAMNHPFNQIDTTTPFYEVYELWGQIPRYLLNAYNSNKKGQSGQNGSNVTMSDQSKEGNNDMVYVLGQVAGIESGQYEEILFLKEVSEDKFPYKEVHYRRRKGRWIGLSNYELCFDQIEKANEITNRFFSSLRLALLHIYQTRDSLHVKNVLTDLLDGDVIVSRSELTALPTEIRGLADYREELNRIEKKCDSLCNSFEVVTGEDMKSGTPFKLGQQQLASATKLFLFIRQNMGLFISDVFNDWLMPSFVLNLTTEHILELVGVEDMAIYYEARKRELQYDTIAKYIKKTGDFPPPEQLQLVGSLAQDQLTKMPKQILVEEGTYSEIEDLLSCKLRVIITGENDDTRKNIETLTTTFQTIAGNQAILQDPRAMKLLNMILEESGYSPLTINMVNETPTNPDAVPKGGAPQTQTAQQSQLPTPTAQPMA